MRCGAGASPARDILPERRGRLAEPEVPAMHHPHRLQIAAIALIAAAPLSSGAAETQSPQVTATRPTQPTCFFRSRWLDGWRATPDARAIYIRVSNTIYRLDLQSSYSLLKDPFSKLINKGTADSICTPLDFRLTVSNRAGAMQWPIVKEMTRLTPEQAAALPRKLRP